MKKLYLVGAGGFARELYSIVQYAPACGRDWAIAGFLDDNAAALAGFDYPVSVVGSPRDFVPREGDLFLVAVATPKAKRAVVATLKAKGAAFLTYIDPTARVLHNAKLGEGCVLCPNVLVSCDTVLGDFVSVNSTTNVGHDARVGPYSTLSSFVGVTRGVRIGSDVFVGGQAALAPNVVIEDHSTVGIGAVVVRRVRSQTTVFGNPARPIG